MDGALGFRIWVGRSIVYIDPYRVPDDAPIADLILVTHGHYDHVSPQDVERLSGDRTWPGGPAAVAERVSGGELDSAARCSTPSSFAVSK